MLLGALITLGVIIVMFLVADMATRGKFGQALYRGYCEFRYSFKEEKLHNDPTDLVDCNQIRAMSGVDHVDANDDNLWRRGSMRDTKDIIKACATGLPVYIPDIRDCDDMVIVIRGRVKERFGDKVSAVFSGSYDMPSGEAHMMTTFFVTDDSKRHWFDHNDFTFDKDGCVCREVKD